MPLPNLHFLFKLLLRGIQQPINEPRNSEYPSNNGTSVSQKMCERFLVLRVCNEHWGDFQGEEDACVRERGSAIAR